MNLWLIFLTGLTVGGVTCMAVQGGLLASVIANQEKEGLVSKKSHVLPVLAFLIAKLASHIVLGFLLGLFGSAVILTDSVRIVIQVAAGLYMIAIALNLLNIHPIFRYVVLQPPRFLTRMVRNESKHKDLFAPFILGLMTIFIPCGTTLAMEALAISSGSGLNGAAILGAFVLGTFPLFFGVGFLTSILGDKFRDKFLKLAAVIVIYLGAASINGALILAGSPITLETLAANSPIQIDLSGGSSDNNADNTIPQVNGVQETSIQVMANGYNPSFLRVKQGVPVKLDLVTKGGLGCTSQFRIPSLGITQNLPLTGTTVVQFTPTTVGKLVWTCSMGMYSGTMEVI